MPAEFSCESDLIATLRTLLAAHRFGVVEAVPTLNRCIDLVAWRMPSCSPWAFECKLRDWQRGIIQAERYLRGAPYAWVCLPSRNWPGRLQIEARNRGVGVLLCDTGCLAVLVRPRKSQMLWGPAEEWLTRAIDRRLSAMPSAMALQPMPPFLETTEPTLTNWS